MFRIMKQSQQYLLYESIFIYSIDNNFHIYMQQINKIAKLDLITSLKIIAGQIYSNYYHLFYNLIPNLVSLNPKFIIIKLYHQSIQIYHDGFIFTETDMLQIQELFKNNNIQTTSQYQLSITKQFYQCLYYLHRICDIKMAYQTKQGRFFLKLINQQNNHTDTFFSDNKNKVEINNLWKCLPVRQLIQTIRGAKKQIINIFQDFSVIYSHVNFILKWIQKDKKQIILLDSTAKTTQNQLNMTIQKIILLDTKLDSKDFLIWNEPNIKIIILNPDVAWYKLKKNRIFFTVNKRMFKLPEQLQQAIQVNLNMNLLLFLMLDLKEQEFSKVKDQIWIYKLQNTIDLVIKSLKNLLSQKKGVEDSISLTNFKRKFELTSINKFHSQKNQNTQKTNRYQNQKKKQILIKKKQLYLQHQSQKYLKNSNTLVSLGQFSNMKLIGQFAKGFIVCFNNNKLYLLDQHACHEKIIYQTLIKQQSKIIQNKITFKIDKSLSPIIQKHTQKINKKGWQFSVDNSNQYQSIVDITKCPTKLDYVYSQNDFLNFITSGKFQQFDLNNQNIKNKAAKRACHNAYRVGELLKLDQQLQLLSKIASIQSPLNCPHGRPTSLQLYQFDELCNKIKYKKSYNI